MITGQNSDGSWGAEVHSQSPDVATTSIAGIALLRMGHTGSRGEFQANTRRAVEYVMGAVERAPADQIAVQDPGTLPQRKLGRNIDTYVAAQFLSEALPTLPSGLRGRAEAALANCVRRIERAQTADGSFAKDGWAPQLSNERLLRGFGTYGGEEHVSYMLVAEAKATAPADEFAAWNKQMRARLAQIQREDGTWRGDHCITSTTFCTAASLITLAVRAHARPS